MIYDVELLTDDDEDRRILIWQGEEMIGEFPVTRESLMCLAHDADLYRRNNE